MGFNLLSIDFTDNPKEWKSLIEDDDMSYSIKVMRTLKRECYVSSVALNTCDRFEVYTYDRAIEPERIMRALSANPINKRVSTLSSDDVIEHLFLLSSGVLSPIFGEEIIKSQIRKALELSRINGTISPRLEKLFNMAISFGKSVKSKHLFTDFDEERVSIAVREAERYKDILIIGSSSEARETARRLMESHNVKMTLRDVKKVFLAIPGVEIVSFDDRLKYAKEADLIISMSKGVYNTLSGEDIELKGKTIFDFSFPHDVDDRLSPKRPEDFGYTGCLREESLDSLRPLIESEVGKYKRWEEASEKENSIVMDAKEISSDILYRLSQKISALDLSEEESRNLSEAILDSSERSILSHLRSKRK